MGVLLRTSNWQVKKGQFLFLIQSLKMRLFFAFILTSLIFQSALAQKCLKKVNFKIEAFGGIKGATKQGFKWQTNVFGIKIVATQKAKSKLQHAAQVLAELLDNDNDGCPDDAKAYKALVKGYDQSGSGRFSKPILLITDTMDGPSKHLGDNYHSVLEKAGYYQGQTVSFVEIHPKCTKAKTFYYNKMEGDCYDSVQEEWSHFIHSMGYVPAWPTYFDQKWYDSGKTSNLTRALDVARGGRTKKVFAKQSLYPASAWYRFATDSCQYNCQAIEYLWWGYLSYSGTAAGLDYKDYRGETSRYKKEFKHLKKADLMKYDKLLTKIFQDSENGKTLYKIPFRAVHGSYTGCGTCKVAGLPAHGGSVTNTTNPTTKVTKATTKATTKAATTKATTAKATTKAGGVTTMPKQETTMDDGGNPPDQNEPEPPTY